MVAQLCQLHADHGLQQGKVLPKWLVARNGKQAGGRRSCRMSAGSRTRFSTTKARCTAMMNTPPCKTRDPTRRCRPILSYLSSGCQKLHVIADKHQLLILTAPKALAGAQCAEGACQGSAPKAAPAGESEFFLEKCFNDVQKAVFF